MGGCASLHKSEHKIDEKNQSSKSRKGRGKTVTPVPGAPLGTINKEEINGFRYSSAETTINTLVHLGSDMSITTNSKPEVASVNFHVTEVPRSHTQSICQGSKDEAYFDSIACWESDCDEDFVSVNGDFLPSAGNTMSLPNSVQGTPRPSIASLKDRMIIVESKDIMVPVERKKKLRDFFMENLPSEDNTAGVEHAISFKPQVNENAGPDYDGIKETDVKYEVLNSPGGYSVISKYSMVNNEEDKLEELHDKQSRKCCLPLLVPNSTINDKRRSPRQNHISKENKQLPSWNHR